MRQGAGILVAGGLLLLSACTSHKPDDFVRGHDLAPANLPLADRGRIYQEAIGASFQVGDPSLYLLLDPRFLPRTGGYGDGDPMSQAMQNTLLKSHIVQGTCIPKGGGSGKLAHCTARLAGYVVRFSDVFQLPADTVSLYLYVQRYSTPTSTGIGPLRFERVYKVVRHGTAWDAVAEGRLKLDQ